MRGVLFVPADDRLFTGGHRIPRRREISVSTVLGRSVLYSLTRRPVTGGIRDFKILKNTEKIIYDVLSKGGVSREDVITFKLKDGRCARALIGFRSGRKRFLTGLVVGLWGVKALASPCLIRPVLEDKFPPGFHRILNKKDVPAVDTIKALFKKNDFLNVCEYLFTTNKSRPVSFDLKVTLKSGGVVRSPDVLIGVTGIDLYDRAGVLKVSFITGDPPLVIFKNSARYDTVFAPPVLRDKRSFALAVGICVFEKVKSDFVRVRASSTVLCREPLKLGDVSFCPVVRGGGARYKINWLHKDGELGVFGYYDGSIVELRPVSREFEVGVLSSGDEVFVPLAFEKRAVKGYLVSVEDRTVRRAVIPL